MGMDYPQMSKQDIRKLEEQAKRKKIAEDVNKYLKDIDAEHTSFEFGYEAFKNKKKGHYTTDFWLHIFEVFQKQFDWLFSQDIK